MVDFLETTLALLLFAVAPISLILFALYVCSQDDFWKQADEFDKWL
jgi:hypothetical protein